MEKKLEKIQNYLKECKIEYNYRVLDNLVWITIVDKLNNFVRIDETDSDTIRLTFQNMKQKLILTNVFKTQEELTEYLRNPEKQVLTDKYTAFVKKHMSACDGHSCERIAALINSYMEEN